jgi:hypothetical protein
MRYLLSLGALLLAVALSGSPAVAGPPLICHATPIGSQRSLPWIATNGWNGADPAYDLTHLSSDTLALLGPATQLNVRVETLRRAVIYSAGANGLSTELAAKLMARTLDRTAGGATDPWALFDAGYFVETLRQAAIVYPLLHGAQHDAWTIRGEPHANGLAWIREAVRLGATEAQPVLAIVERAQTHGH